jgi:hypothetical protein
MPIIPRHAPLSTHPACLALLSTLPSWPVPHPPSLHAPPSCRPSSHTPLIFFHAPTFPVPPCLALFAPPISPSSHIASPSPPRPIPLDLPFPSLASPTCPAASPILGSDQSQVSTVRLQHSPDTCKTDDDDNSNGDNVVTTATVRRRRRAMTTM